MFSFSTSGTNILQFWTALLLLTVCVCGHCTWFFLVRVFRQRLFVLCPGIVINQSLDVDPATGLSTTKSTLEYSAEKEDTDAQFTCSTGSFATGELVSPALTLTITCESLNTLCVVWSWAVVQVHFSTFPPYQKVGTFNILTDNDGFSTI